MTCALWDNDTPQWKINTSQARGQSEPHDEHY